MPRLRGSWVALAGVLWCATTLADTITVTTTDPALWDQADNECSLFEAVEYFNHDKPTTAKTVIDNKKYVVYKGCKRPEDDSSSDTIELPETTGDAVLAAQVAPLELQVALTINGRGFNRNGTHTTLAAPANGPVFRITGRDCKYGLKKVHKAAVVDIPSTPEDETKPERDVCETLNSDGSTTPLSPEVLSVHASAALTLNQALVDGCGTVGGTICSYPGAAVLVAEGLLAADHVVFFDGTSTGFGGAVFVADGAAATFTSVILRDNQAADGVIYAANMRVTLRQSSIYGNRVTAADGAIVHIAAGATTAVAGSIENVTFSGNPAGTALRLANSHNLNHLTIVDNNTGAGAIAGAGALVIDAGTLTLQNSIVARNGALECSGGAGTWVRKYVLVSAGSSCASLPAGAGDEPATVTSVNFSSDGVGTPRLLAELNSTSASRFSATLTALIDPADNGFKFHRPLMALLPWADLVGSGYRAYSHVIDRANIAASSSSCASADQRGDARTDCDLGAIEFKFSANKTMELTEHPAIDTALAGQKIYVGETVVIALADAIGDAELMPNCDIDQDGTPEVTPSFANVAGCPVVALAPAKGSIRFNTDGNLVYTPSGSGFHGADTFVLRVYTTSSRFQDERRFVEVTYTVRADTHGGWQNSSLGGSVSWHWLLLGGLAFWRKKKN